MAGVKSILVLCGVLVAIASRADAQFNNCALVASCFQYFEGSCTSAGKRLVCISFNLTPNPPCNALTPSLMLCRQNNFLSKTTVLPGVTFCSAEPVMGLYSFGIMSAFSTVNTGSGPITVVNYPNGQATCSGFTNVCAASGNNDFRVTFMVSSCPNTPSGPAPGPPAPSPTTCSCSSFANFGSCSTTCGFGIQEQRRTCTNCNPSPETTMFIRCPNNPTCPTTPTPTTPTTPTTTTTKVDGMWGQWGQWSACTPTCGTGTRSRSRTCNNPPPSGGGQGCVEPETQTEVCTNDGSRPGCSGGRGGGGGRRRCRRDCRKLPRPQRGVCRRRCRTRG